VHLCLLTVIGMITLLSTIISILAFRFRRRAYTKRSWKPRKCSREFALSRHCPAPSEALQ
jgi:hypothetical protein